jgi:hypothetical protein
MTSVELWPSSKLHVSRPTWWLEATPLTYTLTPVINYSMNRALPSTALRTCIDIPYPEPLSFQLCWLEWRPRKLWGDCSLPRVVNYCIASQSQCCNVRTGAARCE